MKDLVMIEACQARQDTLNALIFINRVVAAAGKVSNEQAWSELMAANADLLPGQFMASKEFKD